MSYDERLRFAPGLPESARNVPARIQQARARWRPAAARRTRLFCVQAMRSPGVIGPFMVVGGWIGLEKSHGANAAAVAQVANITAPGARMRTAQFRTAAPMKMATEIA